MSNPSEILKKYWGYDAFRPLQEDIIQSILQNQDTLALLPTGGGKSICYQVPGMMQAGICLVVSPLIALMKDQVENLRNRGIKASAIFSGMSSTEIDNAFDNCVYGDVKFLYLSPERLLTEMAQKRIEKMKVNLLAVDEAHCISQWGYDFRPPYLQIAEVRKLHPNIPVLALTATATARVVDDIQEKLQFKKKNVLSKSFERPNLTYAGLYEEDKNARILRILARVPGTAIIYVRNRKKTKEVAEMLLKNGIKADYYHAGIEPGQRDYKQNLWMKGKTRVIVATNAFGMGIDKPDVRVVIHIDLPDSLEAYFQEAGRGGRDEKRAFAILLFNKSDFIDARKNFQNAFPLPDYIRKVYNALGNYFQLAVGAGANQTYAFDLQQFCNQYDFHAIEALNALKFLEREGYIHLSEAVKNPSRLHLRVNNEELYKFYVANPRFDVFVKTILRSYSGLFTEYVKISEQEIANRLKTTPDVIVKSLNYLKSLSMLDYVPETNKPQLCFLTERLSEKDLNLSVHSYELLKQNSLERMEKMIDYAQATKTCRSVMLLEYFNQSGATPCMRCDVCKSQENSTIQENEFEQIKAEIMNLLAEKDRSTEELIACMSTSEQKVINVLRFLADNGKIILDKEDNKHSIC